MTKTSALAAESRPLKVGYVSADLHMHPVGLFVGKVVAAHDAERVTPVIYSNTATADDLTRNLQQMVQDKTAPWAWRNVQMLDDAALAEHIRADGIDILVDLSGHTGRSRLTAFAWKPAPVQISWLGYFATTGLPMMDFVILDPWHAPAGAEAQFSERIIRLPHNRLCYSPVPFAPAVSPAPTFRNGYMTFGSFNNTSKLNDKVLDAWAQILLRVPQSRLILKWRAFADKPYCERIVQFFGSRGIVAERLDLRPMSSHRAMLEQYADIDIALDPFPFSGGHTSCEALWMGVPVITWPQARMVSRQTWSFLNNIGLPEYAARDRDDYIELAAHLAERPERLAEIRATLREKMACSSLCDAADFTRHLEKAFQLAWQQVGSSDRNPLDVADANAIQWQSLTLTPAQALQQAIVYHQAGKLQAAETLYRALLVRQPAHPDANHNLGVMALQTGQPVLAIPLLRAAVDSNPAYGAFWLTLAEAQHRAGADGEAWQSLAQACKLGMQGGAVDSLAERIKVRGQSSTSVTEDRKL